jgi:ubiquinone/menaquinone biosynthesis C-methylase UbiE
MNTDKFKLLTAHYESACKSTDFLKDYWNKVSGIYVNAGYSVFQAGLLSNNFDDHLDLQFARRKINPSRKNILDAGCGIGTSLKHMAAKRPDASFAGLNISDSQIKEANKDLPKNVEIGEGSYDNMPFENDTFDLAIFDQSIGYRPLIDTYSEVSRVLKNGGKAIVSDMCQIDDPDPEYSMQIRSLQQNWYYMCYPVEYHLAAARAVGLKPTYLLDNMNVLLDYSKWQDLVNDKLHEFHGNCPYAPIKVSEFHFEKNA